MGTVCPQVEKVGQGEGTVSMSDSAPGRSGGIEWKVVEEEGGA